MKIGERIEKIAERRTDRYIRVVDRLSGTAGTVASWFAVAIVAVSGWNAIARFLDRELGTALSSNTWLETGWYLFASLFLLGAAQVLRNNRHVRVDVFYERLSLRRRATIDLAGALFLLIPFCVFVLWAVWPTVWESWLIREASPDPGGLPRWPIRMIVPIAFLLLLLQGTVQAYRSLRRMGGNVGEDGNGPAEGRDD